MLSDLKQSYCGVIDIFGRYWRAYGGWRAAVTSPYLHASFGVAALLFNTWLYKNWWAEPIAALPTMIGFAIGAYAIVLGFGDERFRQIIMQRRNGKTSPYVRISASLAHFIIVQLAALFIAFFAKSFSFDLTKEKGIGALFTKIFGGFDFFSKWIVPAGDFIGFTFFVYAIATALATAMAIFRLTTIVERDEPPPQGPNDTTRH